MSVLMCSIRYNNKTHIKSCRQADCFVKMLHILLLLTIGRSNGAMLVLLNLSAAFDTIDHDNLFCMLEKYVGIRGNVLKLIKSYFYNCTQRI